MNKLVAWFDIPALDIDRAVCFYNRIFDLELTIADCGSEKMACFSTGEGAISQSPGFVPTEQGVIVSFFVPTSLDQALADVFDAGGVIVQQKTKIDVPGREYFALVLDSEGNKIGLYGN